MIQFIKDEELKIVNLANLIAGKYKDFYPPCPVPLHISSILPLIFDLLCQVCVVADNLPCEWCEHMSIALCACWNN